jgi:hypothetical protein
MQLSPLDVGPCLVAAPPVLFRNAKHAIQFVWPSPFCLFAKRALCLTSLATSTTRLLRARGGNGWK